jgi:hypothetical protein
MVKIRLKTLKKIKDQAQAKLWRGKTFSPTRRIHLLHLLLLLPILMTL